MDWRFLFVREFLISGKDKNHELRYQRMFKKEGAEAARRERPAETGQIAERVASPTEQGSPVRPASDLRREHRNPVGKSASVEKTGQPGDSGESRRAFVSEPVAALRGIVTRAAPCRTDTRVREGARNCFSKRAILTGSAFDSVSRHLRRVSLTHLATTSLRHVRIRNSATRTPNPLAFSSDNAPKKRRQEKMISLCGAANKIGNDGALNFRLSAVVPSCHSACSHKRDAAN